MLHILTPAAELCTRFARDCPTLILITRQFHDVCFQHIREAEKIQTPFLSCVASVSGDHLPTTVNCSGLKDDAPGHLV